ncbi:FAD/NAD(P)-binding domain-containing protein [Tothia fuscella]|uniref:FAD/NAD(P)-binding domain-containing protein n=1 Tax=Tothia fuscella TaxID=1048955 RepID=A0A9P4TZ43_9PEZI|nr:FAD/NAD(P)-binding domain-containing protein [Tothia fuscella]
MQAIMTDTSPINGSVNGTISKMEKPAEIHDVDVIIIGAGISGVNMSYRIQQHFPSKKYVVLEQRAAMGGTWDLMRYPGIRSDSDLHTFGFSWEPWAEKIPIAEGGKIVKYLKQCSEKYGIDKHILYNHKVKEANWQSREQNWTLTVEALGDNGEVTLKKFRGMFMVLGTGYYDYDKPMEAIIPGIENFKGQTIHPQFWPEDLDYKNKSMAVIGSGATAITLIPALAKAAAKVTMVQRSPSYVISFPNRVAAKKWWEKILPIRLQHQITRLRFLISGFLYRRYLSGDSDKMREFLGKITAAQLPKHIPFDPHFKPTYAPWTQRVCLSPDGDFFKALRDGNVDVATGVIDTVTENAIVLKSGQTIEADIIITATGLRMKYGGNVNFLVDGEKLNFGEKFLWRGVMIQDMPNSAIVQGYTKASWTLGADATATMVCRLIKHLNRNNLSSATPRIAEKDKVNVTVSPGVMGLTSTYIKNALHRLPRTSDMDPWKARSSYMQDMFDAQFASLKKGMQFTMAAFPSS